MRARQSPGERKFADRNAAGRTLAAHLRAYVGRDHLAVLGLPRGGVPVAFEVALALAAPLDVMLVRKLGVPGREELAFGAIASGGVIVLNESIISETGLGAAEIERIAAEERRELERRERLYRGDSPPLDVAGWTALAVDDGLATGATMRAAVQGLRRVGARSIVVAAPVAAAQTLDELARSADVVVCPYKPEPFVAVGRWYRDFTPTTDAQVRELLVQARSGEPQA